MLKKKIVAIICIAVLLFSSAIALAAGEAHSKQGMVVTAHPMASEFGLDILKRGGNAIDAAVGAAIVVGAVEPNASGLGGGGAMLIYLHDQDSLTYINYYAHAPEALPDSFDARTERSSARAVLVPGTVAGLYHALKNYGTMDWKELLHRAIKKVTPGFTVNEVLHGIILDSYEKLLQYPQTKSIYLIDDFPPDPGTTIRNKRLLATLAKIADLGPEVFYQGEIADSIEAVMRKYGGTMRKSDLMNYRVREIAPVKGTYRGYTIYSAPPPQSGITVIEFLNILEFKNLSVMGSYTQHPATFHLMIEAMKRSFADRFAYVGDPLFSDIPTQILISKDFARSRFQSINMNQASPLDPKGNPPGDLKPFLQNHTEHEDKDGSTTHISVVDARGNAVSLTQTLNLFWGSGISVCGFLLNNGMTGFYGKSPVNQMMPAKQPRSTISPSMLFKGNDLQIVIGTPGGGRIISTLVEVMCNLIDFNNQPGQANEAPRFSLRRQPDKIAAEGRFSDDVLNTLRDMGHSFDILSGLNLYFGGVQLIVIDPENKDIIGSSDPRRSGVALGF